MLKCTFTFEIKKTKKNNINNNWIKKGWELVWGRDWADGTSIVLPRFSPSCHDFYKYSVHALNIHNESVCTPWGKSKKKKKEMHQDYLDSHFSHRSLLHIRCVFARPSNSPSVRHGDTIDSRKHSLCFYRDCEPLRLLSVSYNHNLLSNK